MCTQSHTTASTLPTHSPQTNLYGTQQCGNKCTINPHDHWPINGGNKSDNGTVKWDDFGDVVVSAVVAISIPM